MSRDSSHEKIPFFHWCFFGTSARKRQSPNRGSEEVFGSVRTSNLHLFSLSDLVTATRGFHRDNEIGRGGFGVVYKGTLQDGTVVAVKKLLLGGRQGKQEFVNEVRLLTTVQHRNLIRLYGCCADEVERLLIYEYLPHGSLDKHLFDRIACSKLDWDKRWGIIIGIAKGLKYLHEDSRERMVHRDIKPSNILLDESFAPKISDFGVARLFKNDRTHVSTKMAGTLGYLAPEYAIHGKLTEKADIYSFGVVTLEILSGRKNSDPQQKQHLLDLGWSLYKQHRLVDLLDPSINTDDGSRSGFANEVGRATHVALLCIQADASLRPAMSKVVLLLSGQSQIRQTPAKPAYLESTGVFGHEVGSTSSSSRPEYGTSINSTSYSESFAVEDVTQVNPR